MHVYMLGPFTIPLIFLHQMPDHVYAVAYLRVNNMWMQLKNKNMYCMYLVDIYLHTIAEICWFHCIFFISSLIHLPGHESAYIYTKQ